MIIMDDRALGLLGIARRAGRLSLGHDAAKGAVLAGKARLCLISADASERLEREFTRMTQGKKTIPLRRVRYTMEEFHRAIGARTGVLTVDDGGFAEKLLTGEDNAYDDE
ncbi:MAG: ribosomal L7Ae/L30e/S12e/Gadd45 family protein [Oscillospiraceae bacterium]|nr:ribosomal L7Ae/L30e/S12e/Gadd45 family protein [Oscillospiraceae bacterium]